MNSTEAIVTAVEAGLGIGFVPAAVLEKALLARSVVIVPLENGPIKRQFSIALRAGPVSAGPINDLLTLLRALTVRADRFGQNKRKALRRKS
jgi:DNA-binding transcriptional LysR family regulator